MSAQHDQIFHLQQWTPEIAKVAHDIITEVHTNVPELEILFMGAAALELPGKNDIDLDILCPTERISKCTVALSKVLGIPRKTTNIWAEWNFIRDGFEVDCILSDPKVSHVPAQRRVFEMLKTNPRLREEYGQLKVACDGLLYAEYETRKKAFFDRLVAKPIK